MRKLLFLSFGLLYSVSSWANIAHFELQPNYQQIEMIWSLSETQPNDHIEIWQTINFGMPWAEQAPTLVTTLQSHQNQFSIKTPTLQEVGLQLRLIRQGKILAKSPLLHSRVLHPNVKIDEFEGTRLYIYLPNGYKTLSSLPVAYAMDGQNLFFGYRPGGSDWGVDETLNMLIEKGELEPLAVVGIASGYNRLENFVPKVMGYSKGEGEAYANWIVNKLIPYIESKYKVSNNRENRAVIGASYGGPISLYLGFNYADTFSMTAAISPALDYGGEDFIYSKGVLPIRVYLDTGELEYYRIMHDTPFDFSETSRKLYRGLQKLGYTPLKNLFYYEAPGQKDHSESTVAKRIANPFLIFKGKRSKPSLLNLHISTTHSPGIQKNYPAKLNAILTHKNGLRVTALDLCQYSTSSTNQSVTPEGRLTSTTSHLTDITASCFGLKSSVSYKAK